MTKGGMTRRASLGLALGALAAATARAAEGQADWGPVDLAAKALVDEQAAPAVSVSVSRKGRLLYSKGAGLANLETATPATGTSVYKIGSVTKQFTAAALLALAEAGKLSIDDPLARHFPDFPRAGEITLRQMMSHTAGLGNYTNAPREAFNQTARIDYDAAALYQLMLGTSPMYVNEPGTAYAYSNTAYVLLGLIVEKAAGEPYGAWLKRRLFDPAGLVDTAVDDAADIVPRRVSGYTHDAETGAFANASFISMTVPGGAGSIRSTSEDLCRWHQALFGGGILKPESLTLMTTPQRLKDGTLPTSGQKPVEYGFGLGMDTFEGRRVIGHNGGINGFASLVQTFPAEGVTLAILVNCDNGAKLAIGVRALRDAAARAALA